MSHGMTMEEARAMNNLVALVDSMSRHMAGLHEELVKQRGRELYMCADDIIWHRDGDRMIPLTDEGEHVDPREMRHRGTADVQRMRRHESFPTLKQLQEANYKMVGVDYVQVPLVRVEELDVVKRHVRKLEARLSELEG